MKPRYRNALAITGGVAALVVLVYLTLLTPPSWEILLPSLLFTLLVIFTTTFGVPLAGGIMSLLPMTSVAAYLVLGLVPAGWVAWTGAVIYGLSRHLWREQLGVAPDVKLVRLIALTGANASIHSTSILVGGLVFQASGGAVPLMSFGLEQLLPLGLLALSYLAVNYIFAGVFIAARGLASLSLYLRSLHNLVLYEGIPLIFAPLMALTYTRLGLSQFVLFSLVLIAASLITRDLASSRRRLERRVEELNSVQAVGQALSSSLDIEAVLSAIYEQVSRLMPTHNFYVALYDQDAEEVSFPLVVEGGERVQWRSRRLGSGLTEHILHTGEPLLIQRNVADEVEELGLDHIGQAATSWLGVPIMAGSAPLGVIAVQSYTEPDVYDSSHREILVTIGAQAAVAIQNARLYARTDEALARRVRELDSVLRTAREGILLLDKDWRVLAVNKTLADFVGAARLELVGQPLDRSRSEDDEPLSVLVGYSPEALRAECGELARKEQEDIQAVVVLGPDERHFKRTLTPVYDREDQIMGWLLVLRDVSEEVELARLREDMMHMLVHDLRSPLTVLESSLGLIEDSVARGAHEHLDELMAMAHRNTGRMLDLVNHLLDIGKLESGQLPIHPEPVEVRSLMEETAERLAPLAEEAQIEVEVAVEEGLPTLEVDPDLIGRVLSNLLDNALKFTPDEGYVRMWARFDPSIDPQCLLLGVTDNGPGIPPEARSRLFRKFQQSISTQGRRMGTGLGLPFCKLAVEAHGGRIWVESEVGKGSTFMMILPLVE